MKKPLFACGVSTKQMQSLQGRLPVFLQASCLFLVLFFAARPSLVASQSAPTPARGASHVPRPGEARSLALPGGISLELVWIPGGEFSMGCSPQDEKCSEQEKPRHRVRVDGFWMGKTEITQAQWISVMRRLPSEQESCPACPVAQVSYADVQAFLERVPLPLRLPSEAEWEYAARGGVELPYYGAPDNLGWRWDNSETRVHPVGEKQANSYGLFDVLGNVWEWCQDSYEQDLYSQRPTIVFNPLVRSPSGLRVLRGGSWASALQELRVSYRVGSPPTERFPTVGFRVALSTGKSSP